MAETWDDRSRRLLGDDACKALASARVMLAGVGGVGGYALEILVRSGVGSIVIIDSDDVDITNLNRQIISLRSTIGKPKTQVAAERCRDINPEVEIIPLEEFITPDNAGELIESYSPDFIIDAIDTVAPKCTLLIEAIRREIPLISSMGAGGRIKPECVGYTDLWDTRDDGLARAVRSRLKKERMRKRLPVVWSSEVPIPHELKLIDGENKLTSPGTIAAVPAVFGILLGNYALRQIIGRI